MQANAQTDSAGDYLDDSPDDSPDEEFDDSFESRLDDSALVYQRQPAYGEYLALVPEQRRALEIRMGEIRIAPDDQCFFVTYPHWIRLLAVVEDGSPSTLAALPLWAHTLSLSPRLELRVVSMPEASGVLAALTDDPQAPALLEGTGLPLLFAFDEEWQIQAQWGPHPKAAQRYLARWQAAHPPEGQGGENEPELAARFAQEMRLWYNSGLDRAGAAELRAFFMGLQPGSENAADL